MFHQQNLHHNIRNYFRPLVITLLIFKRLKTAFKFILSKHMNAKSDTQMDRGYLNQTYHLFYYTKICSFFNAF